MAGYRFVFQRERVGVQQFNVGKLMPVSFGGQNGSPSFDAPKIQIEQLSSQPDVTPCCHLPASRETYAKVTVVCLRVHGNVKKVRFLGTQSKRPETMGAILEQFTFHRRYIADGSNFCEMSLNLPYFFELFLLEGRQPFKAL